MKDILKKYSKHQTISKFGIVWVSLVLAIGVNLFLLDSWNLWSNLKTSVLNYQDSQIKADISIQVENNTLQIIANQDMTNVQKISLSLTYNPENWNIEAFTTALGNINHISNIPGVTSIIIETNQPQSISAWSSLFEASVNSAEIWIINVIHAQFYDGENAYELSTSGSSI